MLESVVGRDFLPRGSGIYNDFVYRLCSVVIGFPVGADSQNIV